jgi:uncharacterized membrane protein YraQ (UPF0718 family)
MDTSTIVMMAAAAIALIVVYWKSPESAGRGLTATGVLILEIIPRMVAAFTLAGLIQAVVPQDVIVGWMGPGSGLKGILIGMSLGTVTPGGPMTHFPIVASLFKVGVGVGPLVSYLTAWSLFGLQRVIMWEIRFSAPRSCGAGGRQFLLSAFGRLALQIIWDRLHV